MSSSREETMSAEATANHLDAPNGAAAGRKLIVIGGVAVVVIALALRLIGLGGLDPWEDEIYTMIGSGDLISNHLTWDGRRANLHSPLMYIEVKVFRKVFGDTIFAARLPSVLYGTLAVALLYVLLGRSVSWAAGFGAALCLAVHPNAVEWGREARMYSHWLVFALLAVWIATDAVRHTKGPDGCVLNWRWWLLGFIFMYLHAFVIFSVTTIAALAVWLGLIGLLEMTKSRRAGWMILFGAALSGAVYLNSWALTGVGRILSRMGRPGGGEAADLSAKFAGAAEGMVTQMGGSTSPALAALFWVVAVVGLVLLVVRGHWRLTLLLVLIGGLTWLTFPSIAKRHFFAPRYLFVMMLPLCAGAGVLLAWLWSQRGQWQMMGRIAAVVLGVGLVGLWSPALSDAITEPRVPFDTAMKPVLTQSKLGDVVVFVPEWYAELTEYYELPEGVKAAVGPPATIYFMQVDRLEKVPELYDGWFRDFFNEETARPAATWLVIVQPDQPHNGRTPVQRIGAVLEAYGLEAAPIIDDLSARSDRAATLTLRVSSAGVDQVLVTYPRGVDGTADVE